MNRTTRFLWGCVGALVPEVVRIYTSVIHQQSLPDISWKYVVVYIAISIVFMAFAGLFSIAWEPENAYKAIWLGASFPTVISTLARTVPSLPIH
jgi:hypothetical protein